MQSPPNLAPGARMVRQTIGGRLPGDNLIASAPQVVDQILKARPDLKTFTVDVRFDKSITEPASRSTCRSRWRHPTLARCSTKSPPSSPATAAAPSSGATPLSPLRLTSAQPSSSRGAGPPAGPRHSSASPHVLGGASPPPRAAFGSIGPENALE